MTYAESLLKDFKSQRPLRASSLIITMLGDSLMNRGGELWLKDLIRLMEPFGINDRLTRTTVHRLTAENWLQGESIGRVSAYRIATPAKPRFKKAFDRVYGPIAPKWDNQWHVLSLDALGSDVKMHLRSELQELDWGLLGGFTLIHAAPSVEQISRLLKRHDKQGLTVWSAGKWVVAPDDQLLRQVYQLDDLYQRYAGFCERFEPLLSQVHDLSTDQTWAMRTLLIHEYRKIMLRDPHLPVEVIPAPNWTLIARRLCVELYAALELGSEHHLSVSVSTTRGNLPPAKSPPSQRFTTSA